ncbi:MAG: hydroxymyristoyl-ACP dehydratase [Thiohalospira sp.]
MTLDREALAELIPHAGDMCLLDEVVAWDGDRIRCRTRSHLLADHPLRREGRLRSLHAVEYGAQAMAIHGGLLAREQGDEVGGAAYLAAVRDLRLERDDLDAVAEPLEVEAERLLAGGGNMMYGFTVRYPDGRTVATGRAMVMAPEEIE